MKATASGQRRSRDEAEPEADLAGEPGLPALALADLIPGENGEVVLFTDSNLRSITLGTSSALLEEGEVDTHRTVEGDDVSGFRFYRFDNGLRLYFAPDLELILVRAGT
jgi:hypothetical protein